jgi:hypothetical protein
MALESHEFARRLAKYNNTKMFIVTAEGCRTIYSVKEICGSIYIFSSQVAIDQWAESLAGQPAVIKNLIDTFESALEKAKSYL